MWWGKLRREKKMRELRASTLVSSIFANWVLKNPFFLIS